MQNIIGPSFWIYSAFSNVKELHECMCTAMNVDFYLLVIRVERRKIKVIHMNHLFCYGDLRVSDWRHKKIPRKPDFGFVFFPLIWSLISSSLIWYTMCCKLKFSWLKVFEWCVSSYESIQSIQNTCLRWEDLCFTYEFSAKP